MTEVLLYLHILSLAILLLNAGAVHLVEVRASFASTAGEARGLLNTAVALGPVFGIGSLLLVITGATLARTGDEKHSLSSPWIVAAFVALVIINANGAGRLAPRAKRLAQSLIGDGPLSPEQRASVHDKQLAVGGWFNTCTALGIIFLMVEKPDALGSVVALVVAAAIGTVVGSLQYSLTGGKRAVTV